MLPLTDTENESYINPTICHVCKKGFDDDDQNYQKVRDHCRYTGKCRGTAHTIYNLIYKTPETEIPAMFHVSNYDYYFMIKELTEEFKGTFQCLGEIPFR